MSIGCILSVEKGDLLVYYGGVCYGDEVVGKTYVGSMGEFPDGHYPIVKTGGVMRVIHPNYYTVTKIIRKKKV